MLKIASLSVWAGLCAALAGTAVSCLSESAARSEGAGYAALGLPRVQKPASFPSKWDAANWKAREAAYAKAGLVAVSLNARELPDEPPLDVAPEEWCKLLHRTIDGKKLLFSRWHEFGLSSDGKLHCLHVDMPSLGSKEASVEGHQPNCVGGAYQETRTQGVLSVYEVPPNVSIGDVKHLSIPNYDVVHRYKESCPPVPASRPN